MSKKWGVFGQVYRKEIGLLPFYRITMYGLIFTCFLTHYFLNKSLDLRIFKPNIFWIFYRKQ
jgi:hypothetical protein